MKFIIKAVPRNRHQEQSQCVSVSPRCCKATFATCCATADEDARVRMDLGQAGGDSCNDQFHAWYLGPGLYPGISIPLEVKPRATLPICTTSSRADPRRLGRSPERQDLLRARRRVGKHDFSSWAGALCGGGLNQHCNETAGVR